MSVAKPLEYKKKRSAEIEEIFPYIDYLTNICEEDYIRYLEDHEFEYTGEFLGFIQSLYDTDLVDNYEHLIEYVANGSVNEHERCELFSNWMKEMNKILSRPCEMRNTDINFIKRAFLTVIRMEKIFPGSWGIDVETGTWLKLLKRVKELYDSDEL